MKNVESELQIPSPYEIYGYKNLMLSNGTRVRRFSELVEGEYRLPWFVLNDTGDGKGIYSSKLKIGKAYDMDNSPFDEAFSGLTGFPYESRKHLIDLDIELVNSNKLGKKRSGDFAGYSVVFSPEANGDGILTVIGAMVDNLSDAHPDGADKNTDGIAAEAQRLAFIDPLYAYRLHNTLKGLKTKSIRSGMYEPVNMTYEIGFLRKLMLGDLGKYLPTSLNKEATERYKGIYGIAALQYNFNTNKGKYLSLQSAADLNITTSHFRSIKPVDFNADIDRIARKLGVDPAVLYGEKVDLLYDTIKADQNKKVGRFYVVCGNIPVFNNGTQTHLDFKINSDGYVPYMQNDKNLPILENPAHDDASFLNIKFTALKDK